MRSKSTCCYIVKRILTKLSSCSREYPWKQLSLSFLMTTDAPFHFPMWSEQKVNVPSNPNSSKSLNLATCTLYGPKEPHAILRSENREKDCQKEKNFKPIETEMVRTTENYLSQKLLDFPLKTGWGSYASRFNCTWEYRVKKWRGNRSLTLRRIVSRFLFAKEDDWPWWVMSE